MLLGIERNNSVEFFPILLIKVSSFWAMWGIIVLLEGPLVVPSWWRTWKKDCHQKLNIEEFDCYSLGDGKGNKKKDSTNIEIFFLSITLPFECRSRRICIDSEPVIVVRRSICWADSLKLLWVSVIGYSTLFWDVQHHGGPPERSLLQF